MNIILNAPKEENKVTAICKYQNFKLKRLRIYWVYNLKTTYINFKSAVLLFSTFFQTKTPRKKIVKNAKMSTFAKDWCAKNIFNLTRNTRSLKNHARNVSDSDRTSRGILFCDLFWTYYTYTHNILIRHERRTKISFIHPKFLMEFWR